MAVAARSLLEEPRAPGNEATWEQVKAKFPDEDDSSTSEAAAAAVAASASDSDEGSDLKWRPEEEFDPQIALEVIHSRNALSDAGSDGLRFSHLQSIIRTIFGREKFGAGIEARGVASHSAKKAIGCPCDLRPVIKPALQFRICIVQIERRKHVLDNEDYLV